MSGAAGAELSLYLAAQSSFPYFLSQTFLGEFGGEWLESSQWDLALSSAAAWQPL